MHTHPQTICNYLCYTLQIGRLLKLFYIFLCGCLVLQTKAQTNQYIHDSLQPILLQAFQSKQTWHQTAASLALLSQQQIQQINPNNYLAAFNAVPGVRMEERSPASYRLNIRGNMLRAPFGVRNIKVYWNNLPLSDAGGNTYFNLLDPQAFSSVEIIKGAASSMYGAGMSGVILLHADHQFLSRDTALVSIGLGSWQMRQQNAQYAKKTPNGHFQLFQSHQQSNGYRQQSAMQKDLVQYTSNWSIGQHQWQLLGLLAYLYYQTPGGITLQQMQTNPTLARQATANLPSAIQQKTAVYNTSAFIGMQDNWKLNASLHWQNACILGSTSFANPFITNFEERQEQNLAIRSQLNYQYKHWQFNTGIESLWNHTATNNFGNNGGIKDTLQFKDNINAGQLLLFAQLQYQWKHWQFTTGIGASQQLYGYRRISITPSTLEKANSSMVINPRWTILYAPNHRWSIYASLAKGFSPASLAEIHPADGNFYRQLQPETAWNYELGLKAYALQQRFQLVCNIYQTNVQQAIVRKTNPNGSEYFANAGSMLQKGIEAALQFQSFKKETHHIHQIKAWLSATYQPYTFGSYVVGNANYSGKAVTGIPKQIFVAGVALQMLKEISFATSFNYTSTIPLTDANDEWATDYRLLQIKIAKACSIGKLRATLHLGIDNLLNEQYSLGNDINAIGRRFYNPAPTRNFFTTLSLAW